MKKHPALTPFTSIWIKIEDMDMTKGQYELKKLMKLRLAEMQAKNPQFSLRAFAKSLNLHAASLSEFFNDKRQFSPKLQKKIVSALNISPDKKAHLLELIDAEQSETVNVERIQLDTDSYYLVTDAIYYSILCLIETTSFKEDYMWMSKRLKKTPEEIKEAVKRLERVGYIKRLDDGKMVVGEAHLMTSDDVANMSLRLRHAENLDSAKDALLNLPVDERYFRFETLAIGMDDLPEFKKAAQEFLDKITSLSHRGTKDEVYEFTLNFFPRTVKNSDCSTSDGTKL